MATRLTKPVRRRVEAVERHGLIVTLYPNATVGLRPHRARREHIVPLGQVYRLAVAITGEADRQARASGREAARVAAGLPPRRRLVTRGKLGGR